MKARITIEETVTVDPDIYKESWEEKCDDDGHEEGNDYPPVDEAWALEQFIEDLENGNIDLNDVLINPSFDVTKVEG